MGLRKSHGNMYDWVTHMHTHIEGECPHRCAYCYVGGPKGERRSPRFTGKLRLDENSFGVVYGHDKTIFLEHQNDLLADEIPLSWVRRILAHANTWPDNDYVLQTKNPARYRDVLDRLPPRCLLGCTIETNRTVEGLSRALPPADRASAMSLYSWSKFVTIEPILDFDVPEFVAMIRAIGPEFVNIGADSKDHGLAEPTRDKVMELAAALTAAGITIRKKINLERLVAGA